MPLFLPLARLQFSLRLAPFLLPLPPLLLFMLPLSSFTLPISGNQTQITKMGSDHRRLLILLLFLVAAGRCSAQSPDNNNSNNKNPYMANPTFNPSMAIVIVVLISAFFFLGFFSVYIRKCAGDSPSSRNPNAAVAVAAAARSRRQPRGLDPEAIAALPTLVYSDVKAHKIGKGSLECAVCLSEFDDEETLRLLPKCDHVFHADCIDAWLAAHVTCPVCRSNVAAAASDPTPTPAVADNNQEEITLPAAATEPVVPAPAAPDQVAIDVGEEVPDSEAAVGPERKCEIENLERFVKMKRAQSRARAPAAASLFPRSHSTGHSLVLPGENLDRYTLRLPEGIRKEIVERAQTLQKSRSMAAALTREESSRRGSGGSVRGGGRSIRLGRSDRWGSFLLRNLSVRMPNWGRRADGEGSTKGGGVFRRGDSSMRGGDGSAKGGRFFWRGDSIKGEESTRGGGGSGKLNAVVAPFDYYGGGAAAKDGDSQSSTAALSRV